MKKFTFVLFIMLITILLLCGCDNFLTSKEVKTTTTTTTEATVQGNSEIVTLEEETV